MPRFAIIQRCRQELESRWKAVGYAGVRKMEVANHPNPTIKSPADALLRVAASGICGNDLHKYDGRTPPDPGTVVGRLQLSEVTRKARR